MSDAKDLIRVADAIFSMKTSAFSAADRDMFLAMEHSKFTGLVAEATWIIGSTLGPANNFNFQMSNHVISDRGNKFGKPSFACVNDVEALVRAAANQIARKEATPKPSPSSALTVAPYVDTSRIAAIEALSGGKFDFAKLAQLCRELNAAHSSKSHYSTAMLVRAITDHVPPVFNFQNFETFTENYSGGQSFKASMQHLKGSVRNIANGMLHGHIRKSEALPSEQQVDFRQALDLLLSEIVRTVDPKAP